MTRNLKESVVIVTGASRGIGRRIAFQLAERGAKIVAVGRTNKDLDDTATQIQKANGQCHTVAVDLTTPEGRALVISETIKTFGQLDGLVNAAGVAAHGEFETGSEDVLRGVMEINFFAAAEMIRLCVPELTKSGQAGRQPVVMNVASLVGKFGMLGISEHGASKHALIGLTESLRCEFVRFGIDVLMAAPSIVKTDDQHSHLLRSEVVPSVNFKDGIDPDYVALRIVKAMESNKTESYIGKLAFWVNMGSRFGPRMLRKILWRRFKVYDQKKI